MRGYELVFVVVAAGLAVLATPARAQSADGTVALVVHNAEPQSPVRCTLLLAHFFTVDAGVAEAGAELRLSLARGADGTLTVPGPTGEAMAVENVACGSDDTWSATWSHVPLQALRQGTTATLRLDCTLTERLRCVGVTR